MTLMKVLLTISLALVLAGLGAVVGAVVVFLLPLHVRQSVHERKATLRRTMVTACILLFFVLALVAAIFALLSIASLKIR